jgi:hypothetical protein
MATNTGSFPEFLRQLQNSGYTHRSVQPAIEHLKATSFSDNLAGIDNHGAHTHFNTPNLTTAQLRTIHDIHAVYLLANHVTHTQTQPVYFARMAQIMRMRGTKAEAKTARQLTAIAATFIEKTKK